MGFWLLVPGVGMGGGLTVTVGEGIQFSLPSNNPEFSLPTLPQFSEGTM